MKNDEDPDRWARLRFAIIGPLLSIPPESGMLKKQLEELGTKQWQHPVNGSTLRFSVATLQRWYYTAKNARDPIVALRHKRRTDAGQTRTMSAALIQTLRGQYQTYPGWSMQLHYDNLVALAHEDEALGPLPSYATVRRYMKGQGLHRKRRPTRKTLGAQQAEKRLENREIRSYEVDHVHGLWHLDFHHGSRTVLLPSGRWVVPILLAIMDDHSRLICHLQWYLNETAEVLVHGFGQALQRRGLPRALMTDNGSDLR